MHSGLEDAGVVTFVEDLYNFECGCLEVPRAHSAVWDVAFILLEDQPRDGLEIEIGLLPEQALSALTGGVVEVEDRDAGLHAEHRPAVRDEPVPASSVDA